jgi:predicted ATPase
MEQFCLYLKENELITVENGLTKIEKRKSGNSVEINAVLVARIDRLSGELKEAVQMGSVLGREFDIKVIHEMLEVLIQIIIF